MIALRPWLGLADTYAVQRLASQLWPRGPHAGGIGWEAAIDQLPAEVVLAEFGGQVVGWAGRTRGDIDIHLDPSCPEAARTLIGWATTVPDGTMLTLPIFDGDEVLRDAALSAHFSPTAEAVTGMFRTARSETPQAVEGYLIRGVRDGEEAARVDVHRRAWRPASLPWPGGTDLSGISPDATSRFTAEHFRRVRTTWLYDPELDLVVEARDGSLAACCTVWWDPNVGCAEIEPLGVTPEHRRKGLATALCLEAAHQIWLKGGDRVFINVGPRPDYPAPAATYVRAGFQVTRRGVAFSR